MGGDRHPGVALTIDGDVPDSAPRVYVAEVGFSHLRDEDGLWSGDAMRVVKSVAAAMRAATEGLYLAFLESESGPHPLVLIQDDRSAFTERHHGHVKPGSPAWRDFHFAAGHVTVDVADEFWRSDVIAVRNLSGGPSLPPDALIAFLEGVGLLLDTRELGLRRLDLSGHRSRSGARTCDRDSRPEQAGDARPTLRPLVRENVDPRQLGVSARGVDLRLLRVDVVGAGAQHS